MIEKRLWDFGVFLGPGVDQDRVGLKPAQAQHGRQKRRLVAAYAVLVVERDANVVRLVSRCRVLGRNAHVADLLRYKIEYRLDLFLLRFTVFYEFIDCFLHFRRIRFETRLAQLEIPLRYRLPVRDSTHPATHRACRWW